MFRLFIIGLSSLVLLSACASGTFKARQLQREQVASAAGLYCEFINGDAHPDVDVELNLQMAHRCDANRNFSITNYKNASDQIGVMYCCAMQGHEPKVSKHESKLESRSAPSVAAPKASSTNTAPKSENVDKSSDKNADKNISDEVIAE